MLESLGYVDIVIQPWQVDYDLVWAIREVSEEYATGSNDSVQLECCQCHAINELTVPKSFTCVQCEASYELVDGILHPPK